MPSSKQHRGGGRPPRGTGHPSAKDRSAHEASRGKKAVSESARASLSRNLSRRDLSDTEFEAAVEEFHAGSDRVAAIMGAALVEDSLIGAIDSCLKDASDRNALFYDQGAPFGTFKARILAGKALGLFKEKIAQDLDRIRDIRNQFAHALLSFNFDTPEIVNACSKMGEYRYSVEQDREIPESRKRFEAACWKISTGLLKKANANLNLKVDQAEKKLNQLDNMRNGGILNHMMASTFKPSDKNIKDDVAPDEA
jgi:hypothetical protein